MTRIIFIFTRLWRYFNLYFLKPFDAINDTLTSSLLYRFDWSGDIVEIGSGDGEFSYIMHGGTFPLWFDRYLMVDLKKQDIFDTHEEGILKSNKRIEYPKIILAIDAKESHVEKIREIGFAKKTIQANYEALPLKDNSVEKIFFYTAHGMKDHEQSVEEANRVLAMNGKMLVLLYDEIFKSSFLCYNASQHLKSSILKDIFLKLDNGRFEEITKMSKNVNQWELFFHKKGFRVVRKESGLSTFAWKIYDIQTRPILKILIRFFNTFPIFLRSILKLFWMVLWYPILLIFYILYSNEFFRLSRSSCYLSFELQKIKEI